MDEELRVGSAEIFKTSENKRTLKKQAVFSLMIALLSLTASAQKQGNVWVFGDGSGLNFNGSSPTTVTTSLPLESGYNEGASSICDSAGNLLFYSNGEKIWNRYNNVLPHADSLMGNFSAVQAAIILPQPGSNSLFYVFTIDCFQDTLKHGLHYTVVDACQDSGRGDVVPAMKNIPLMDSTGETLTAIKHANGHDYWIIAHKFWTDKFYAFRLTSPGVADTVITHIGRVHVDSSAPTTTASAIGTMASSPDGRHIALVNANIATSQYFTELFDFDPATGTLSNYVDLETRETAIAAHSMGLYGCSFSPNSSKLYLGAYNDTDLSGTPLLAQYDISMGAAFPDSLRSSLQWIQAVNQDSVGIEMLPLSLQIGPNGKMYVSGNSTHLWEIEQPDLAGAACQARIITAFTVGKTYTMPNILPSYAYDNGLTGCTTETLVPGVQVPGSRVLVYPNPAAKTFTVVCPGDWQATLTDLAGRKIASFSGTNTAAFSKGEIAAGMYMLSVKAKDTTFNQKIVIQ